MLLHTLFDILAAMSSLVMTVFVYRWRLTAAGDRIGAVGIPYAVSMVAGAVAGAYLFGTLNLWLSGHQGAGRSIIGAFAGAIAAIELLKRLSGIKGSTGIIFVPAVATTLIIGRIGCFLSGLDDFTYGTPTNLPWGVDFGDGRHRHPVQLYESAAMASFLVYALVQLARSSAYFTRNGFYLLTGWYAVERFGLEFLKPYAPVVGPLNIFHLLCLALLAYAVGMLARGRH